MNGQASEYGGAPPVPPTSGGGSGDGGGGVSAARSKVAGPAITLMVTAGVGIALHIVGILIKIMGIDLFGMQSYENQDMALARLLGGVVGIAITFLLIGVWVVVLLGALKMKNLESYSFAMVAVILSMIPCNCPCCLVGVPVGIWGLVVLMKPEVKAAFRS